MNRTKAITALLATLISTAALSTPALAGDNKVYPGSTCKPINSGTTGLFYGNGASNLTHVTPNPVDINVACPVVRDNTTGPVGSGPNAFIDVNSNTVSCSLDTTDEFGVATLNSTTAVPFQPVAGVNAWRFDIRAVPQVSQGAYIVKCTLPPSTSVLRYSVSE